MKDIKTNIRILINNRLVTVQAEPVILGDTSEKIGDPFTGVVLGAVQLGHRKWQFFDMVTGHRFHHQRKVYRSPEQGLKALAGDIREVRFREGMELADIAKKSWLFAWWGGIPMLVNPVVPHLPEHITFDDEHCTPNKMVAKPCPRCEKEDWELCSSEVRPENPPEEWAPDLRIRCRACGLQGPSTIHGIPHTMFRWNMVEWDENWQLKP